MADLRPIEEIAELPVEEWTEEERDREREALVAWRDKAAAEAVDVVPDGPAGPDPEVEDG
jgi:hypothetical protein